MFWRRTHAMALVGAVAAAACPRASAQTVVYGTASAGLTYTDNLFNASSRPAPGGLRRQEAWYITATPGVGLSNDAPRASHLLTYSHSFYWYLTAVEGGNSADTAAIEGRYSLTRLDELTIAISGSRTSTALAVGQASVSGQAQTDTNNTLLNGAIVQQLRHAYSATWTGRESASFGVTKPIGGGLREPVRLELNNAWGAEYRLARDAWAFDWTTVYFRGGSLQGGGSRLRPRQYLQSGPVATWRHDLSDQWASELHAGFAVGRWLASGSRLEVFPNWGGAVQWEGETLGARLGYSGQVAPNLITNQLYFTNSGSLSGAWTLLPEQHVALSSSHVVAMHRLVASDVAVSSASMWTWMSSAELTWSPEHLPQFALTYQYIRQSGARDLPGVSNFSRNVAMLVIQDRFPEIDVGRVVRGAAFRVDGADLKEGQDSSRRSTDTSRRR